VARRRRLHGDGHRRPHAGVRALLPVRLPIAAGAVPDGARRDRRPGHDAVADRGAGGRLRCVDRWIHRSTTDS